MSAIRLHLAAFDGDLETVNRLLAEDAPVDARTDKGETPLLFAAGGGYSGVVRTLLKGGADVNALPNEGASALRRAIRGGHAETNRLLLAKGADPEAVIPAKVLTAEDRAQFREKMREAREQSRQCMAAFGVVESADKDNWEEDSLNEVLADKLESKKPVQESGTYRCLMLAITSRSLETLHVLLEAGFSPNPPPEKKDT